ncbi:MAG TPA: SDR family NAD(P)-dependent oxidoreductase [Sandaracinaceae bacterium]
MTHSMERWRGRVALVTGASSGIGRATAARLAREGMRIAICARRVDRLEGLAAELRAAGADVLVQPTDLRDERSIDALFSAVRERFGGVDVLVNNAGLGRAAPLTSGATEHWREMLEVNVLALCICTREAIRDMRARGDDGHVIHVSSMAAHRVPPGSGVYSATKFAVRSLTEGLRQELRELRSGIRVTAISPGFVETEFAERFHGSAEAARETYSRYRVLRDEDVAETIAWVLAAPPHMQVHDVLMRPTHQTS